MDSSPMPPARSMAAHSAWVASHVLPAMPPGAIPPIVTTRPITKIATRA